MKKREEVNEEIKEIEDVFFDAGYCFVCKFANKFEEEEEEERKSSDSGISFKSTNLEKANIPTFLKQRRRLEEEQVEGETGDQTAYEMIKSVIEEEQSAGSEYENIAEQLERERQPLKLKNKILEIGKEEREHKEMLEGLIEEMDKNILEKERKDREDREESGNIEFKKISLEARRRLNNWRLK